MERRHDDRKHSLMYLVIIEPENGKVIGHLGDVSDRGLMLLTDYEVDEGSVMNIRIHLPAQMGFDKSFIDTRIEIRWSKPDMNPAFHCNGCHIVDITDEDRKLLLEVGSRLTFEGISAQPAEEVFGVPSSDTRH